MLAHAPCDPQAALPSPGTVLDRKPHEPRDVISLYFPNRQSRAEYLSRMLERNPHCAYCGRPVSRPKATLDHVIPVCQNGSHCPANLVVSCELCNQSKGPRSLIEWILDLLEVADRNPGAVYIRPQTEGGDA